MRRQCVPGSVFKKYEPAVRGYALTREIMAHFYAKLRGEVWRYSAQALSKLVRANSKTRRIRRK